MSGGRMQFAPTCTRPNSPASADAPGKLPCPGRGRPYTGTIIHPCGMFGGRMQFAPTRVPGQTWQASLMSRPPGTIIHPCGMSGGRMLLGPYTSTRKTWQASLMPPIRLGDKKCRTGFTAGPAPMKKVIDMNTPPKKEGILLRVSFRPCNPRATPGGSPR